MRSPATGTVALLVAALGIGVASCAKAPPESEASLAGQRNISSWEEVRLYWDADPDRYRWDAEWPQCEYVKLRWVRADRQPSALRFWEELQRAIWDAGGDAAVMVTATYESAGNERWVVYEGMAIRFTDPECMH